MKIVLVHNSYREAGGEDIVFDNEARLLSRAGHTVIPYVRSNWELSDISALQKIAIVVQMTWSSKVRRDFTSVLDWVRPDIVHVHNTFMAISPSIYSACAERGIPIIQALHNFRLLCPGGNFFRDGVICRECVDQSLLRGIQHGCYRNSRSATAGVATMLAVHRALNTWKSVTRFIALTEFAKEIFVASGLPPHRFVVKPNFIDPDPCERTGRGEYALFVGRIIENKGLRILLDAWKMLPASLPLHIVGEGPDRATLEAEAHRSNLSGIVFRGRLPHRDVIEAVKGARFIIVPSMLYEGFPMCIVESFGCGTPVLCSQLGGLAEIVQEDVTGLHFNPGDPSDLANKVEWAWNHPEQLAKMGHAARGKYERDFTPERNYAVLMDIYEQALAETSNRRPLMANPLGVSQRALKPGLRERT